MDAATNLVKCGDSGDCYDQICQADATCAKVPKEVNISCSSAPGKGRRERRRGRGEWMKTEGKQRRGKGVKGKGERGKGKRTEEQPPLEGKRVKRRKRTVGNGKRKVEGNGREAMTEKGKGREGRRMKRVGKRFFTHFFFFSFFFVSVDVCSVGLCSPTGDCIASPLSNIPCSPPLDLLANRNVSLCQNFQCVNGQCLGVPKPVNTSCALATGKRKRSEGKGR